MKNGKRGEILTILAVTTLVALAITTVTSSVLVNRTKVSNQGVQAAQVCSADTSPEVAPAGYKWQSHCSEANKCNGGPEGNKECNIKYPGKVTWCYGFDGPNKNAADFRCMTLDAVTKSVVNPPANPPNPTAPASNTCQAHTPPGSGEQPKCSAFTFGKAKIDSYLWSISCNASCNPNNEEASRSECARSLNKGINEVWCYGFGDGGKCMSYAGPAGSCTAAQLSPEGSSTGGTGEAVPTCQAQDQPKGVQPNCSDLSTGKMIVGSYLWNISCNAKCNSGANTESDRAGCATALGKSVNEVWCYGFADGPKCMSFGGTANSCVVVPLVVPSPKPSKTPVPTAEPTVRIPDPPDVPASIPDDESDDDDDSDSEDESGDDGRTGGTGGTNPPPATVPVGTTCQSLNPPNSKSFKCDSFCGTGTVKVDGATCAEAGWFCCKDRSVPMPTTKTQARFPTPTSNARAAGPPTCSSFTEETYLKGADNKCYFCAARSNRSAALATDQKKCDQAPSSGTGGTTDPNRGKLGGPCIVGEDPWHIPTRTCNTGLSCNISTNTCVSSTSSGGTGTGGQVNCTAEWNITGVNVSYDGLKTNFVVNGNFPVISGCIAGAYSIVLKNTELTLPSLSGSLNRVSNQQISWSVTTHSLPPSSKYSIFIEYCPTAAAADCDLIDPYENININNPNRTSTYTVKGSIKTKGIGGKQAGNVADLKAWLSIRPTNNNGKLPNGTIILENIEDKNGDATFNNSIKFNKGPSELPQQKCTISIQKRSDSTELKKIEITPCVPNADNGTHVIEVPYNAPINKPFIITNNKSSKVTIDYLCWKVGKSERCKYKDVVANNPDFVLSPRGDSLGRTGLTEICREEYPKDNEVKIRVGMNYYLEGDFLPFYREKETYCKEIDKKLSFTFNEGSQFPE